MGNKRGNCQKKRRSIAKQRERERETESSLWQCNFLLAHIFTFIQFLTSHSHRVVMDTYRLIKQLISTPIFIYYIFTYFRVFLKSH